jgi:lysosomal Pro-X carboxypeptidase
MVMPQGDDPSISCFTWVNFDKDDYEKQCIANTGMKPRWDWALDYFGGRDVHSDWASTSNIIFSNGDLDPWHAGGVLQDVLENNYVIYIQ